MRSAASASTGPIRAALPLWNSLCLERNAPASLQDQIVEYFRDAISSGRLKAGGRVPSSRMLAAEQKVARITVVQAYERLVAEGYLAARGGAGMFVAEPLPDPCFGTSPSQPSRTRASGIAVTEKTYSVSSSSNAPPAPLPLAIGVPDLDSFPWAEWTTISTRVHRERPRELLGYGDPRGLYDLRATIADYVGTARGIRCTADQVLILAGSQQGLDLAARALIQPGEAVWFEEPGYLRGRKAFDAAGLTISAALDSEGLCVENAECSTPQARLAVVSPSHQYPLGITMSLRRRLALLQWAERADAWILENDHDGEYRYAGQPLAPLYALDRNERVLYLATFSKILAPSLRLGYLILPSGLVDRFTSLKSASDHHSPGLTQRVLARFIQEGGLARHLRRMRVLYARRRDALIEALEREAAGVLSPPPLPEIGLHVVAKLTLDVDDAAASRRALASGVQAAPLSSFYAGPPRGRGFVLGFAGTHESEMVTAVRRLVEAVTT